MKKILTCAYIILSFLSINRLNAQACGTGSGPGVCSPTGQLSQPGLSPSAECLGYLYLDSTYTGPTSITVQFQNYDTITALGSLQNVDSLQIISITNFPPGLCWATNKANNLFYTNENGCINFSGTVMGTDTPGQYQLIIMVEVWLHSFLGQGLTINAASEGLYYYLRLKSSPADTCIRLVDTTGEAAGTNLFIPYGPTCPSGGVACIVGGIQDVITYINSVDIIPNPLSNEAVVKFYSTKTGKITERITNVIGSVVYSNELQLTLGQNTHTIRKGNLAAGVYIYTLNDGESIYSKKLVISE